MIKHIVVTQEDIDKGVPEKGDSCPVYFAIERVCDSVYYVGYATALFVDPNSTVDYAAWFPDHVNAWITTFDNNKPVGPFEFDLDIPDAACN